MSQVQQTPGASRYDALIATFVGICALCISAYTAHVQRQQVRATVWPILEYSTSNEPMIRLSLANKGMGPAIIRRVQVKVDGQPQPDWQEALQKLLGSGRHRFSFSTLTGRVLSPGESIDILVPQDSEGKPLTTNSSAPLAIQMDQARERVAVEVCFSSTLDECWTLRSGKNADGKTTETRTCPAPSLTDFQQ